MRHQDLTINHRLESWVYANAAARTTASGFVPGDLGRIAYQSDTGEYWRLTATTPTWQRLALVPLGGAAGQSLQKNSAADLDATWKTPPGCSIYSSVALGVANNTVSAVVFNSELYDTDSMHSGGASQVIVVTPGVYMVNFQCVWSANATGFRQIFIYLNGANIVSNLAQPSNPANVAQHQVTTIVRLAAGDTLQAMVYQNSGGAVSVGGSGGGAPNLGFQAQWLGP